MPNKNLVTTVSYVLLAVSALLTAFLAESRFGHVWFNAAILSAVLLSMYSPMKDVFIVMLVYCCCVWGMGMAGMLTLTPQLFGETAVLFLACAALLRFESGYKAEKVNRETIINYKKSEIDGLAQKMEAQNRENHRLAEELKNLRKYFSH